MASSYVVWLDRAKMEFRRRVGACTTQFEAHQLIDVVAESVARSAASNTQDCLELLNGAPELMRRRLPDDEMDDCENIIDVVWAFIDHDISRELEALVPSSLPEK